MGHRRSGRDPEDPVNPYPSVVSDRPGESQERRDATSQGPAHRESGVQVTDATLPASDGGAGPLRREPRCRVYEGSRPRKRSKVSESEPECAQTSEGDPVPGEALAA
jgi:hypothetical protein